MAGILKVALVLCLVLAVPLTAEEPLATLGGEPIYESDLEIDADWHKLERQRHELREKLMNSKIAERLLAQEAERKEVTVDVLLQEEILPLVGQPTSKEVQDFYNSQKAQINRPLKEVRDELVRVMQQQKFQRHVSDFVKRLFASADVKILLDPPRLPVDLDGIRARGPKDAPVTVVEYSDFQCPFCKRVQPTLAELATEYEKEVRWGFKDMPLSEIHPEAVRAAQAARCADDQGKFWEFRARLFEQELFTDKTYTDLAKELKIKDEALLECINSGKHEEAVMADFREARGFGIEGTPGFLINGIFLSGAQGADVFREIIDSELGRDAEADN